MKSSLAASAERMPAEQPSLSRMLFVTSMPASRSNALGIQALYLAEAFAHGWAHCYWYNHRMGESAAPNSYRLNTSLPYRWPFATGRGFVTRMLERCGIGWWRGSQLMEAKKRKLRSLLGDIGFAYVAPIKNDDATRCREILQVIASPFAVHIWDFLDEDLNEDYRWLFSHAAHVFCVSPTMFEEIHAIAPCDTSVLLFTRPRSQFRAKYCGPDTLKIGLIGSLFAYTEGLDLLRRAINSLRREFADIRIKYIGPPGQLDLIPDELKPITEYAGFLDDDGRDRALAGCNLGYIPGPSVPPRSDSRSRHSIPSRSADYMTAGLPIISATDPLSATGLFFSPIRDRGVFLVSEPSDICRAIQKLRHEDSWSRAAAECSCFFEEHLNKQHVQDELRSVAERFL